MSSKSPRAPLISGQPVRGPALHSSQQLQPRGLGDSCVSLCHVEGPRPRQTPGQLTQGLRERIRASGEPHPGLAPSLAGVAPSAPASGWVTRGFCPPGTLQSTQLGYLRGWLQPRVFLDAEWAGAQARATLASPLRLPQCPLCLLLERRAPSLGDIKRGPRRPTPNTHATHPRPPQARSLGPHERGPCHPHRERRGP